MTTRDQVARGLCRFVWEREECLPLSDEEFSAGWDALDADGGREQYYIAAEKFLTLFAEERASAEEWMREAQKWKLECAKAEADKKVAWDRMAVHNKDADDAVARAEAREAALVTAVKVARKTLIFEGYNVEGPTITSLDAALAPAPVSREVKP